MSESESEEEKTPLWIYLRPKCKVTFTPPTEVSGSWFEVSVPTKDVLVIEKIIDQYDETFLRFMREALTAYHKE